jgi:hypothetical protein
LYIAKSVFFPINASLRWLNNISVFFTQVSLLFIGQQDLEDFFNFSALSFHSSDSANFTPTRGGGTTNTAPTILRAIQAASQSAFYQ